MKRLFFIFIFVLAGCASTPSKNEVDNQSPSLGMLNANTGATTVNASATWDAMPAGSTRKGYITNLATGNGDCPTGVQTCIDGKWVGPILYETCDNYTKSCDGVPHGSTKVIYLQSTTHKGVPCPKTLKTCVNGSWAGPIGYESCTELP